MNYLLGLIAAFVISALLIPPVKRLAIKLGAIDNPKEAKRKIHNKIMARGGGLAIYAAFILVSTALIGSFSRQFIGLIIAGWVFVKVQVLRQI